MGSLSIWDYFPILESILSRVFRFFCRNLKIVTNNIYNRTLSSGVLFLLFLSWLQPFPSEIP